MKYRKKPIVIEATQWFKHGDHPAVKDMGAPVVLTLEGPLHVTPGDWIITGVKGEHYPCKPDVFAATYEQAENTTTAPERWQMVPVEPTREMIDAARQHHEGEAYLPFSLYKAMLAAATKPGDSNE